MKTPSQHTALHLDSEKYQELLTAFELSPSEKEELLEALFGIAVHFVDQAFKPCGKNRISSNNQTYIAPDLIESNLNQDNGHRSDREVS